MRHRFTGVWVGLVVVVVALVRLSAAGAAASPGVGPEARLAPTVSAADAEIVVDGVPQPRYAHDGRWYVEARKGREYAIRLTNPFPVRVAVALSVDGLNTIDARETTAREARKWVIEPYGTVTIAGWQTSQSHARRFEFTTEARSYGQALGRTARLGVISAVFFKERVALTSGPIDLDQRRDTAPRRSLERAAPSAAAPTPLDSTAEAAAKAQNSADEFAATGMGRRTDHIVTAVSLDLEDAPVQAVDIRYEFRPQLVRLGILPPTRATDPLSRREGARGFEPGFSPEPTR